MGFFAIQGWQPLNDSGDILALGTLTFSRTGTSTAKNTYSNKALTSANSNPVTLDAAGRTTSNIFLLEDEGYRVVLKNSAGTTIWTRDEVFALSLSVDEDTRRQEIVRSPMDHGAAGDGSTNDATAIAAALTQISSDGGGVLDLEGKTYRCDSTLSLFSNLVIRNGALDFSNCTSTTYLSILGSKASAINLSGNASWKDTAFALDSVSGLAAGDLLGLTSTAVFSHASGSVRGEIVQIQSIASLTVTCGSPLHDDYTTAASASVSKLTTVDDVTLERLTVIADDAAAASSPSILYARLARRLRLRDCRFTGIKSRGVNLLACIDTRIDNGDFDDGASSGSSGVNWGNASDGLWIRNCRFRRLHKGFGGTTTSDSSAPDGPRRNLNISDCWVGGVSTTFLAIDNDSSSACDLQYFTIRGNVAMSKASGGTAVVSIAGVDGEIVGNAIMDDSVSGGIRINTSAVPSRSGRTYRLYIHDNAAKAGITSDVTATGLEVVTYNNYTGAPAASGVLGTAVSITATEIVGTDPGDIGATNGVTLVAAVSGKIIEPVCVVVNYTFATAAYTGGGDVSAKYSGGENATGVTTAAESFGAGASNIQILRPLSGAGLVNTAFVLVSASGFTQPGTAAGTAVINTFYRLIDAT